MPKLFTLINDYLMSLGLVGLTQCEYNDVVCTLREGSKVDAIKFLRNNSRVETSAFYQCTSDNNSFYTWLSKNNRTAYEVSDSLGLKGAKDICDFLLENPTQAGL